MDASKDYYSILGVMPQAEDIVIRAAYKALAQRYHPDRFQGDKDEANRRMIEINEAYEVLSKRETRNEYDRARGPYGEYAGSEFEGVGGTAPPGPDPLEREWHIALKYYPELTHLDHRLSAISWRLANTFRAVMIETKTFDKGEAVAETLELQFLERFFGTNPEILDFARTLIQLHHRDAARALNDAVRVLGSNVEPYRIIHRIEDEFGVGGQIRRAKLPVRAKGIAAKIRSAPLNEPTFVFIELIDALGGTFEALSPFSTKCTVKIGGKVNHFPNDAEFKDWVRRDLLRSYGL